MENPSYNRRLKIISSSLNNIKFFRYELDKIMEELKKPELILERNKKFSQFINPSDSFI